jgi:hypothetical protein
MDLHLHIGTEKTGTTSVQRFFKVNREMLARNLVLYPETPGRSNHTGLAAAAQSIAKHGPLRRSLGLRTEEQALAHRAQLIEGLAREVAERPYKLAVMSGEHCSSRLLDDEEVRWLRDEMSRFFDRIHIIIYIRRQDDYLLSTYSTSIKSGSTAALSLPPERAIENRYDHWDVLERWSRVFGRQNVTCRRFERKALKNGDIVDDILGVIGLDPGLPYKRPEDVNEALDAESLEFLRLMNKYIPRFVKGKINPARDNLVPLLARVSSGPLVTLSTAELDKFMALFEESNRKVALEYFGGIREDSDNPLFEPRSDRRTRTERADLTVERAVELCAWLWQEKQSQVERVVERARRLRAERGDAKGPGGPGRKRKRDEELTEEDWEN